MASLESTTLTHQPGEAASWRQAIVSQLRERNNSQTKCFYDLIGLHNRLFDNANTLRGENLQLSIINDKLRTEALSGTPGLAANAALEAKLLAQAEELSALHKRRGEHTQQIVDLNNKLQEVTKDLQAKETGLAEITEQNKNLQSEIARYITKEKELENINQMLRDEHQALQLAFASLEDKLRRAQEENRHLVERLIKYKAKDAEKMNEENDNFLKKKQAKMQKELEEAARDTRTSSPDRANLKEGPLTLPSSVPTKVSIKFNAHEGEVNAVRWSPTDRILATGGADRKVKLWDIGKGGYECKGMLVGSNAGIMSVDFDSSGNYILGASNDFASRVWTAPDYRLRHTLTGHCAKVMAAKFLGEPSKVVTGSHDRTLKIWDLRSRACIETKFTGSSCNDLVTSDGSGSTIISGHFDKTIRFWDTRTESGSNDIVLQGKITSLDLSRDANYLLSCVRDDTLQLLDLRMKMIVVSFSADGFKVGCDWTRATFSPDGQYAAVGSSDGSIFVWSIPTNKIEAVLKDHTDIVTAVSWYPHGTYLASVDKAKWASVWGDHV